MDETDSTGQQPNDMLNLVRKMKREQGELKQRITELTNAQGLTNMNGRRRALNSSMTLRKRSLVSWIVLYKIWLPTSMSKCRPLLLDLPCISPSQIL